jgi:hypothetical protein
MLPTDLQKILENALACYAAFVLTESKSVLPPDPYQFLPSAQHKFDLYFNDPESFQKICRFTIDETIALIRLCGYNSPTTKTGHYKYTPFCRFVVFLAMMADGRRYETVKDGTLGVLLGSFLFIR